MHDFIHRRDIFANVVASSVTCRLRCLPSDFSNSKTRSVNDISAEAMDNYFFNIYPFNFFIN